MKLLVTGGSGQLAQNLFRRSGEGIEIILAGRPAVDLADPEAVANLLAVVRPAIVVNAAAYTAVDKAESEPQEAWRVNAAAAANVAKACAAAGVPVIHISTDYVFDGLKAAPYEEADATNPLSAYGRSKLEGERLVSANSKRHVILRTSWLFSPFGHNFLKTILYLSRTRDEIRVVCDQIGAPTFAGHLAGAIIRIAPDLAEDTSGALSGIYHLTAAGEAPWSSFAQAICEHERRAGQAASRVIPIPSAEYPLPAKRPANSRLACNKFESAFGFALPHWSDGLEECLKSIRAGAG
jgi:dTDP-4-dehydrorhamnose reductase